MLFGIFRYAALKIRLSGMAAVMFGHLPLAIIGLAYVGLPPAGAWQYVFVSALLHLGYQVFLLNAYRFGELTQIYPVARGASATDYSFYYGYGSWCFKNNGSDWRNFGFWGD